MFATVSPVNRGESCVAVLDLAGIPLHTCVAFRRLIVEFQNKVVAITGAHGGIGQELCKYFGGQNAAIAALDRNESVTGFAEQLRKDGIKIEAAVVDIVDADAVRLAFANLAALLGPVDILINNAGVTRNPTLERTTPGSFKGDVDANLNGAFNCTHAVLPAMKARRSGVIVNIGSVNGLAAFGDAAYSAGKAGLISLTKAVALEFGRHNIRANIVCPGTVRTPNWSERASRNPEILTQLARWYPLGRIVEPIDVIRAVAFLASDAASAITGIVLPVDCGLTAGNILMARELTLEDF
jgi:NAD(P)-dependent dehydrogenase (short-subunit alcohol dehydrogenase family)